MNCGVRQSRTIKGYSPPIIYSTLFLPGLFTNYRRKSTRLRPSIQRILHPLYIVQLTEAVVCFPSCLLRRITDESMLIWIQLLPYHNVADATMDGREELDDGRATPGRLREVRETRRTTADRPGTMMHRIRRENAQGLRLE